MFRRNKIEIPQDPSNTFEKIEKDGKIFFKGLDGKEYPDSESLKAANLRWLRVNCPYIGLDGKEYPDSESLNEANKRYMKIMFAEIDKASK